jgi:hypothetical protein
MTTIARQDTFSCTVTIDGRNYGVFEGREGGAGDSEETKTRLGAMGPEVSLGGAQTIENVTVKKLYDLDGIGQDIALLYARRGRARCSITTQPMDKDGNVHGRGWTYQGILKQVTPPDYDAEGNDAAMIELEITVDSPVA